MARKRSTHEHWEIHDSATRARLGAAEQQPVPDRVACPLDGLEGSKSLGFGRLAVVALYMPLYAAVLGLVYLERLTGLQGVLAIYGLALTLSAACMSSRGQVRVAEKFIKRAGRLLESFSERK